MITEDNGNVDDALPDVPTSSGGYLAHKEVATKLAGAYFDQLWSSRDSVFQLLHHTMPSVRAAALICGNIRWSCGSDPVFQQLCCQIASSDEGDPQSVAITTLSGIFSNTQNRNVQRILTRIIRDEKAPNELRNHAYRALHQIEFGFEHQIVVGRLREFHDFKLKGIAIPLAEMDLTLLDRIDRQ